VLIRKARVENVLDLQHLGLEILLLLVFWGPPLYDCADNRGGFNEGDLGHTHVSSTMRM